MGGADRGRAATCSSGRRRSGSPRSSTAWSRVDDAGAVVRPAMLWNDVKSAPQAAELVTEFGGPGRVGGAHRVRADDVVHRHQAPLAGRARAGARRPGAPGHAAARLADLAAGRRRTARARQAGGDPPSSRPPTAVTRRGPGTSPPPRARWLPGLRRAGARPAGRAAPGRRARRGGRADPVGRGDLRGHRGQHGRGARPGPARRRRRGVHRHLGHRLRGDRAAVGRPDRAGQRVRRRDRPVPAARLHAQRGPGARRHRADARRRPRPGCPTWR